jgi:hypothetical protein
MIRHAYLRSYAHVSAHISHTLISGSRQYNSRCHEYGGHGGIAPPFLTWALGTRCEWPAIMPLRCPPSRNGPGCPLYGRLVIPQSPSGRCGQQTSQFPAGLDPQSSCPYADAIPTDLSPLPFVRYRDYKLC